MASIKRRRRWVENHTKIQECLRKANKGLTINDIAKEKDVKINRKWVSLHVREMERGREVIKEGRLWYWKEVWEIDKVMKEAKNSTRIGNPEKDTVLVFFHPSGDYDRYAGKLSSISSMQKEVERTFKQLSPSILNLFVRGAVESGRGHLKKQKWVLINFLINTEKLEKVNPSPSIGRF